MMDGYPFESAYLIIIGHKHGAWWLEQKWEGKENIGGDATPHHHQQELPRFSRYTPGSCLQPFVGH